MRSHFLEHIVAGCYHIFNIFLSLFKLSLSLSLSLSFLFSLISLSQILPLVGLRGLSMIASRSRSDGGWGWLRPWVKLVEAIGWRLRLRFRSGLLGWWVLWRFWLQFVSWGFFILFYFILFWWLGVEVVVGGGSCGCGHG